MKYCIVDTSDKQITETLTQLGYQCIDVIPSGRVSPPICRHTDVLYKKLDNTTIIASACQRPNFPLLKKLGYRIIINDKLKPGYKTESLLNYVINNKYFIFNPKTAERPDKEFLTVQKEINVNQGYTGCSTICVNDDAYITDDENIYKTLADNNIDCLLIGKGDIELEGYDYGFIGGASVKLNENEILFFGDIKNKEDKNRISEFMKKYNVQPIFIEGKKLKDIGSALIL